MCARLRRFEGEIKQAHERQRPSIEFKRTPLVERQRADRKAMNEAHQLRWQRETAARLRKGAGGLWARITGKYSKITAQNEFDAWQSHLRARAERDRITERQLREREGLQRGVKKEREASAVSSRDQAPDGLVPNDAA